MASLWDQARERSAGRADDIALIEPGRFSVRHGELWKMVDELARLLRGMGLVRGDRVGLVHPDGASGIVSMLAAMEVCGCSTMNPALTAGELEADIAELAPAALIVDTGVGNDERGVVLPLAERLGLPVVDARLTAEGCSWTVRERSGNSYQQNGKRRDHCEAVVLLHTSATTGRRKVAPLTAINLRAMLDNTIRALRLTADDRLLMMARLFHVQGVLSPLAQLLAGGSVIAGDGFAPGSFPDWLEAYRPTWYTCGPTLHRAILEELQRKPLSGASSLRFARSGGSPLAAALKAQMEEALGAPVLDVYGLTETGGVAATALPSGDLVDGLFREGSVGRSMGPEVAIMGQDGILLVAGEEGEIVVGGASVMAGYLNDAEANREAFCDGWFRTGDLGRLDADGFLFVTGRIKEIINRGGQKILPNEVDAALKAHDDVREVATFGVPHPTLGEDVACAVVLKAGAVADVAELRNFAAQRLASFKVPRRIILTDSIPYGSTGKPQRLVLRERYGAAREVKDEDARAADSIEEPSGAVTGKTPYDLVAGLNEIWSRHLGCGVVSPTEDFFGLGGDSLIAATMLLEVETRFGLDAERAKSAFFVTPTIKGLARMVAASMAGEASETRHGAMRVVPLREGRRRTTLFLAPADGEEGVRFRRLAKYLDAALPVSILRPANTWHEVSVSSIEDAGARAAAVVRAAQPEGPYLLGGYCYGGVVAFATACELERQGKTVSLILFDVPTPGSPHIVRDWRTYWRAAMQRLRRSVESRSPQPIFGIAGRSAWFALRWARPRTTGIWATPPMRWLCTRMQRGYFSFYYPGRFEGNILHFLAEGNGDILLAASCKGWARHAAAEVTIASLPGDHKTVFDEANLMRMATAISDWASMVETG